MSHLAAVHRIDRTASRVSTVGHARLLRKEEHMYHRVSSQLSPCGRAFVALAVVAGLVGGAARRLFIVDGALTVRGVRITGAGVTGANGANGAPGAAGIDGGAGTNGLSGGVGVPGQPGGRGGNGANATAGKAGGAGTAA